MFKTGIAMQYFPKDLPNYVEKRNKIEEAIKDDNKDFLFFTYVDLSIELVRKNLNYLLDNKDYVHLKSKKINDEIVEVIFYIKESFLGKVIFNQKEWKVIICQKNEDFNYSMIRELDYYDDQTLNFIMELDSFAYDVVKILMNNE